MNYFWYFIWKILRCGIRSIKNLSLSTLESLVFPHVTTGILIHKGQSCPQEQKTIKIKIKFSFHFTWNILQCGIISIENLSLSALESLVFPHTARILTSAENLLYYSKNVQLHLAASQKVIKIKSFSGLFLLNRIWDLGWFGPVGQFRVHEFLVLFISAIYTRRVARHTAYVGWKKNYLETWYTSYFFEE